MKKGNEGQYLLISCILLFLLCLSLVSSYNTNELKAYYSFEETNTDYVNDTLGNYNLTHYSVPSLQTNPTRISGLINNALYYDNAHTYNSYTGNITNLYSYNSFTINFWILRNYNTSEYSTIFFRIGNNLTNPLNHPLVFGETLLNKAYFYNYDSGRYIFRDTSYIEKNRWNMITIEYIKNTSTVNATTNLYINGFKQSYSLNVSGLSSLLNSFTIMPQASISMSGKYAYIDEYSIWNNTLGINDVMILYNYGFGLSYNNTISNADNVVINSTWDFDGFYHNYCWYNVNCYLYNVSGEYCQDYIFKVCSINCADTFDSYQSVGLENNTASFNAICVNDEFLYQSPTYEGLNSSLIKNYCYGEYLCKIYNITRGGDCENYYDGQPNKIDCIQQTGSILAECFDTYEIYTGLNTYPPNNDYEGYCSECKTDCVNEGATSCSSDLDSIQTCKQYHSCLKLFTTKNCLTTEKCVLGTCILNTTTITGEENNDCGIGCLFNAWSTSTKYLVMIITTIFILLLFVLLLASFGDATSGLLVGLVVSMILSLTLTIIFNLSLLIPILYILVGGSVCVIIIRKIFIG
jgi:hypothetical protein